MDASQRGWTVTDAATEIEPASAEIAVAPQTALPSESAATIEAQPMDNRQLLAAAPLGADAYRPFPMVETGQTVSPGMPMLPGSDSFLPEAPNRFNGYVWPTQGTFTSGYGWRWGRMHRGIDVAGPVGTPIVAAASGVVVRSGWNSGGYGNLVDIRHADGSLTRYAHNSRLLVREGQQVSQGQQIALMGSTGRSTGPHLHFEIHLPGTGTVNPMAYLPRR
jgi:murein DD-endopeptidase MepM/ murein hydrolase activator NlpD